ncbi:MAG: Fic family protein [Erysipelotrichaceae bacterium]
MYESLAKIYHKNPNEYETQYANRINSESMMKIEFNHFDFPLFYVVNNDMMKSIYHIMRVNVQISHLIKRLPVIAILEFEKKCLIEEIIQTNELEGVYSSRKDLLEVLNKSSQQKELRFSGIVNTYLKVLDEIPLKTNQDIRKLYDDLLEDEIGSNESSILDGFIYRKESVSVYTITQKEIHRGIYPEEKVIDAMSQALSILSKEEHNYLIRVAVFHYLFGYIHPFYDGNGRMSRFLSSHLLSKELNTLIPYRLSYTINEQQNEYYDMFKLTNDTKNKGELTFFILWFLKIIQISMDKLLEALNDRESKLNYYAKKIDECSFMDDKRKNILFILLQATLFSNNGLSYAQLEKETGRTYTNVKKHTDYFKKMGILVSTVQGKKLAFKLNLDELDVFIDNVTQGE